MHDEIPGIQEGVRSTILNAARAHALIRRCEHDPDRPQKLLRVHIDQQPFLMYPCAAQVTLADDTIHDHALHYRRR
jgi:hypothetical protein